MRVKQLFVAMFLGLSVVTGFLWLLTASETSPVYAAGYTVSNTNPIGAGSLRQAILDANNHSGLDTITFGVTGTIVLTTPLPTVTDTLIISGPGAALLTISGDHQYRVFEIDSGKAVTISGLTIRDGRSTDGYGGGINNKGSLTLSDAVVVNNTSYHGYGGGIWSDNSLYLKNVSVISNTAIFGGGIYVYSGRAQLFDTQVLSNTVFSFGTTDAKGGGIYVLAGGTSLEIERGRIAYNTAPDYGTSGGGIYMSNTASHAWIEATQIISNSAHYGGGLYLYQGKATLSNGAQILSNTAQFRGGAAFLSQNIASFDMTGGEISGNASAYDGGGLYISDGNVTLRGTQITRNEARHGDGGGVRIIDRYATFSMTQGTIANNIAVYAGGGINIYDGLVTLSGTQVVNNKAMNGGGIFLYERYAWLNVTGGSINDNTTTSDNGGGVYLYYGKMTLDKTQVAGNTSFKNGGGVYVEHGKAVLTGTHVLSNSAVSGGGLYVSENGVITATNGCIVNNSDMAVVRATVTSTLSASNNWWGASDGPGGVGLSGHGDTISGSVTYQPFKTSAPAGCPFHRYKIYLPLVLK